jgi:hypothetical protein
MWHFPESRQAGFPTRRGGFRQRVKHYWRVWRVLIGIADRVAVHRHARHAVCRRREKVLVEIKTDGKPLRFCRQVQAVIADGDRRAASELDV